VLAKDDGETLEKHTLRCIEVAKTILNNLPIGIEDSDLRRDLILALAFHDTGKAAIGFQEVLRHKRKDWHHWRHEILSASLATLYGQSDAVVFSVITHHRQIPLIAGDPTNVRTLELREIPISGLKLPPLWFKMKDEWERNYDAFEEAWSKIIAVIGIENTVRPSMPALALRPEWFDRGKNGQRHAIGLETRMRASMLRGLLIASDHLASGGHTPPKMIALRDYTILERPFDFQKRASSCQDSIIIRSPTGSGKTAAALLWAQANQSNNARIFYVLPNIASINAMRSTLSRLFGENNVGLLHSRATEFLYRLMEDRDASSKLENQSNARILKDLARTIWYPARVCTPHQILRYTLRGKGWETMLSEFPRACFIFDEIHAYEPRITGLILASVKLLERWGARFCFMSATLPVFLKELISKVSSTTLIAPNENEHTDRQIMNRKRHAIEVAEDTVMDHIERIQNTIRESKSVLIVCNTVASAQRVYKIIKCNDKLLLHSRFNQEDRLRIERRLTETQLPRVTVSTQAIEVSLNVDFQTAFIEPAPVDALIQRMGRVNRFAKNPPTIITIFRKEMSKHSVYMNRQRVDKSVEMLHACTGAVSEEDLVRIANDVYGSGYSSDENREFEEGFNHPDLINFDADLVAGASEDWVEKTIERADRNVELLPSSLQTRYVELMSNGFWIEANSLLVPVHLGSLMQLLRTGLVDVNSDPWLTQCRYDSETGLDLRYEPSAAIF
jgi:CRISPR-associated endonuclease/helicase Cas3